MKLAIMENRAKKIADQAKARFSPPSLFIERGVRGVSILLLLFSLSSADYNLDQRLFLKINGCRNAFFDGASVVLSDIAILPNVIYVYSLGYGHFRHNPEARNFGKTGLLVDAAVITVNQSIKTVVKRERPKFALPEAEGDYADDFVTRILPSEKYSFPSQSASLSMSAAVVLSAVYPDWSAYFYSLAVLNGWARIYRAAHYPGDVLAGEALGLGLGFGMLALIKKADTDMDIRNNKPKLPIFSIAKRF